MDKKFLLRKIGYLRDLALRSHDYNDEDRWYSCPKAPEGCADDSKDPNKCYCGADEHNACVHQLYDLIVDLVDKVE